jgi:hypothetical protein
MGNQKPRRIKQKNALRNNGPKVPKSLPKPEIQKQQTQRRNDFKNFVLSYITVNLLKNQRKREREILHTNTKT